MFDCTNFINWTILLLWIILMGASESVQLNFPAMVTHLAADDIFVLRSLCAFFQNFTNLNSKKVKKKKNSHMCFKDMTLAAYLTAVTMCQSAELQL